MIRSRVYRAGAALELFRSFKASAAHRKRRLTSITPSDSKKLKYPWDENYASEDRLPLSYWSLPANQRRYMDWLGVQLNVKSLEDWYLIKQKQVVPLGGSQNQIFMFDSAHSSNVDFPLAASIIKKFGGSFPKALSAVYLEHDWKPWLFNQVAADFWNDVKNKRRFCDEFMQHHSMTTMAEWYKVKLASIRKFGGGYLVARLHTSLSDLLRTVYPEHEWLEWKFDNQATGLWDRVAIRKKFLDWFAAKNQISKPEDWYRVTTTSLKQEGATYLLKRYNSSLQRILEDAYSDHKWLPWKFSSTPRNYWQDVNNQREYLDWLGKHLQINSLEGWYNVSREILIANFGRGLMVEYGGSIQSSLRLAYPSHTWLDWMFSRVENNFWDSEENRRRYFDWLGGKLGLASLDGWYNVSTDDVYSNHGAGLMAHHYGGSVMRAVMSVYPDHAWSISRFKATAAVNHDAGHATESKSPS